MAKNCLSYSISPYLMSFVVHKCKMIISLLFFHFFKILVFRVVRVNGKRRMCKRRVLYWGKWARNGLKWQNVMSVPLHISGGVRYMIVTFGTNICSNFFHFFKILIFPVFKGDVKGQKMTQLPISFCHTQYLRNRRSYYQDFWYTGVMQWYLQVFFFIFFF